MPGGRASASSRACSVRCPIRSRDRAPLRRRGLAGARRRDAAGAGASGQPAARRQPAAVQPAVRRGHPGRVVGPCRQAGRTFRCTSSSAAAAIGARLCLGPRLPSQRRRLRRVLRRMPTRSATARSRSRSGIRISSRDLHRLKLLKKTVRPDALVMIDANEAWGAKEALVKLDGHPRRRAIALLWVEDPILRNDFAGPARCCAKARHGR